MHAASIFEDSPPQGTVAAWATRAQAKYAIVRWIEGWYNPRRLHSSIDYLAPNEKENAWHTADRQAA